MQLDGLQGAYASATQAANVAVLRRIQDQNRLAGRAAVGLIEASGKVQEQAQVRAAAAAGNGRVDVVV
jgi:hypothetical protein